MDETSFRVLTCPRCGTILDRDAGDLEGQGKNKDWSGCVIVIIRRPDRRKWKPESEMDAPPKGIVFDVVDDVAHHFATFVRQFNGASLDESGSFWAAVTEGCPRLGEEVELVTL